MVARSRASHGCSLGTPDAVDDPRCHARREADGDDGRNMIYESHERSLLVVVSAGVATDEEQRAYDQRGGEGPHGYAADCDEC